MFSENKEFYTEMFQIIEKLEQIISTFSFSFHSPPVIVFEDKNCSTSVDVKWPTVIVRTGIVNQIPYWKSCYVSAITSYFWYHRLLFSNLPIIVSLDLTNSKI